MCVENHTHQNFSRTQLRLFTQSDALSVGETLFGCKHLSRWGHAPAGDQIGVCDALGAVDPGDHPLGSREIRGHLPVSEGRGTSPVCSLLGESTTSCDRRPIRQPFERSSENDKDGALKGILSLDDIALRADADGLSKDLLKTMKAICDRQTRRAGAVA